LESLSDEKKRKKNQTKKYFLKALDLRKILTKIIWTFDTKNITKNM
jgi:hypothetical protein